MDVESGDPLVSLSVSARATLGVHSGDALLISDTRWWFGGLRSLHARVAPEALDDETATCGLDEAFCKRVMSPAGQVRLERVI